MVLLEAALLQGQKLIVPILVLSCFLVGVARLELATLRSQSVRSSHLNYTPIKVPGAGLGPARHRWHRILSPARIPFRHPGIINRYDLFKELLVINLKLLLLCAQIPP